MTPGEIREARQALGLTQIQFGQLFQARLKTVQDWEYGRRRMQKATEELLQRKMEEKELEVAQVPIHRLFII
jgi:DNA-binding transcriptional regulator YiaG